MAIAQNFPTISPSLSMDFAAVQALDPRITYTRASTATYYGTRTALAEQNLFLYSQEFNQVNWQLGVGTTITANTTVAPDGTTTADTVNPASGVAEVFQAVSIGAGTYTLSVWLSGSGTVKIGFFNATDGVQDSTDITLTGTLTRYSITRTLSASSTLFYPVTTRGAATLTSLVVWGAQLEQRSTVTAYTPTTTQPITNYIPVLETAASGVARFDHNPTTFESLGLLIEQQSTNLLTYSEQFDNAAWTKNAATITDNTVIAPDGTVTGDLFIPNSTASDHYIENSATGLTAAATYTSSVYAKASGYSVLQIFWGGAQLSGGALRVNFDLINGVIGSIDVGITATITAVGNGWYRFTAAVVISGTGLTVFLSPQSSTTAIRNASYTGNGFDGIFLWGAQLE